jgi:light-regulated signal transduction histidine kinase (bacteriophytochrome)
MTQALESQTADLKRSNDELTQFAYVASHDLQEPLRMVASYTELLSTRYQGQLDERADKYIAYISEGASRMQRLIRELLAYARVGTRAKAMAPVNLDDVARNVLGDLKALAESADAEIIVARLPTVLGDDLQLGQVLQNLIGNGIKFRANRRLRVTVKAERDGDKWRVTVEDNGIGIDMRFHDRVFEIFRRLHERDSADGTGVGLAIVKRVVERHGGRVWFESTLNQGTRFHFTVPATDQFNET